MHIACVMRPVSLVVHNSVKLLISIVRQLGSSCLRSRVILEQWMPGSVWPVILYLPIDRYFDFGRASSAVNVWTTTDFVSDARRTDRGWIIIIVVALRESVDRKVCLLSHLLMMWAAINQWGRLKITLGSCLRVWLRAKQSSWFLVTATAAAVDVLKPSRAYCCWYSSI